MSILLSILAFIVIVLLLLLLFYLLHKRIKNENDSILSEQEDYKLEKQEKLYIKPTEEDDERKLELEEDKIVGIVDPIGYWTNKIFSEKMGFLNADIGPENERKGYWQKLVLRTKAASKTQTKSLR